MEMWQNMFATHVMGPVALTKALLPFMRAAGRGGRIVLVSSAGGVRGQPGIAPYSAAKGALERWGASRWPVRSRRSGSASPFWSPEPMTPTSSPTQAPPTTGTSSPYARLHQSMNTRGGRFAVSFARPPEKFTPGLLKALDDSGAFRRRGVGPPDASMLLASNRVLPSSAMHHMSRIVMGIPPRHGSMRGGAYPPLTAAQRAMVLAAKVLPQPVMQRLAEVAMRRAAAKQAGNQGSERNA